MAKPPDGAIRSLSFVFDVTLLSVITYFEQDSEPVSYVFPAPSASGASAYIFAVYFRPGSRKSRLTVISRAFSSVTPPTNQSPLPVKGYILYELKGIHMPEIVLRQVSSHTELCHFVQYGEIPQIGLLRELIPESKAVIKKTESQQHVNTIFFKSHSKFVVMVADFCLLSPDRFPGTVKG